MSGYEAVGDALTNIGLSMIQREWAKAPRDKNDLVLVVQARDMPHYLAISQVLFTQDANVRNVKAFFATKRAKFTTTWPILKLSAV